MVIEAGDGQEAVLAAAIGICYVKVGDRWTDPIHQHDVLGCGGRDSKAQTEDGKYFQDALLRPDAGQAAIPTSRFMQGAGIAAP